MWCGIGSSLSYSGGDLRFSQGKDKNILETHQPSILDEEKSGKIDRILEEAKKFYRERGML